MECLVLIMRSLTRHGARVRVPQVFPADSGNREIRGRGKGQSSKYTSHGTTSAWGVPTWGATAVHAAGMGPDSVPWRRRRGDVEPLPLPLPWTWEGKECRGCSGGMRRLFGASAGCTAGSPRGILPSRASCVFDVGLSVG